MTTNSTEDIDFLFWFVVVVSGAFMLSAAFVIAILTKRYRARRVREWRGVL